MMRDAQVSATGRKISLILVNFSTMNVDLLRRALQEEFDIRLAGAATDATMLSSLLESQIPDIALVSADESRGSALSVQLLEHTSTVAPAVKQIVVATDMSRENVVSYFRSGARGLLCGSQTDLSVLLKCVRCVSEGQIWANSAQLDLLLRSLSQPRSLEVTNLRGDSLLSNREAQVLHLLADGLSNRELAATMKLSEHTIKNHIFHIFDKLGVSNRLEAVLYAISHREQRVLSLGIRPQAGVSTVNSSQEVQ